MKQPIPVILSSATDVQLWPLPPDQIPQQYLHLIEDRSPLQQAALRLARPPVVVCHADHRFIVAEQMRQIQVSPLALVIEPAGCGTAPAAAAAALILADADHDTLMLLMPSDHLIGDVESFRRAVENASPLARSGAIVAFGITATAANPECSYIRMGEPLPGGHRVDRFVEKLDTTTASDDLATGDYCWNSGIYLMSAGRYLDQLEAIAPGLVELCRDALAQGRSDPLFTHLDDQVFALTPARSIDHALMESFDKMTVVPLDMGWSDTKLWRECRPHADAAAPEAGAGTRVSRPWGWFETIEEGERFRVKQIQVEPGGKLSLQKHWHRSEHWVVVKGTALVTRGDSTHILRENESTFIPATTPHRLENPGKIPLLLIEVQSGEYVGEDDIVRMEDIYGRSSA